MFAKYYQDELAWLREMGQELAHARPEMARYLGEAGADPDVERLLEGFAFLTGRIREKLDDEFPEVTHGLMDMLCPHYLRPIPSMAILQISPKPTMPTAGVVVPRGTLIDSRPVDGTRCRFSTTGDLVTSPFELTRVELVQGHRSVLQLHLKLRPGRSYAELGDRPLRLHLGGDVPVARALYVALCHYLDSALVRVRGAEPREIDVAVTPAGFGDEEAVIPVREGSIGGLRLLQEYFAFPERFMFVDVDGLQGLSGGTVQLDLEFKELPEAMPPVSLNNFVLDCVPVVNLFPHDGDPVRAESGRSEYQLRPSGGDPMHYEIYSLESVVGRLRGTAEPKEYRPFFAFEAKDREDSRFYQLRRGESLKGFGTDVYLRLGGGDPGRWADLDTVSVELMCTNRDLPTRLDAGDISEVTPDAPIAFDYRNVSSPSSPVPPPLGAEVHWRLLSHMTLNLRRLADRESLCAALSLYDFRARVDRQARRRLENLMGSITSIVAARQTELLDGVPVRGTNVALGIDEEKMGGEGEAFLLGTLLSEFFAQYVTLNSFSQLRVTCNDHGEVFSWPARIGRRIIL